MGFGDVYASPPLHVTPIQRLPLASVTVAPPMLKRSEPAPPAGTSTPLRHAVAVTQDFTPSVTFLPAGLDSAVANVTRPSTSTAGTSSAHRILGRLTRRRSSGGIGGTSRLRIG